jgi:hypothetical protein
MTDAELGKAPSWCRPKDWVRCDDCAGWHSVHFHHDRTVDSPCRVCRDLARRIEILGAMS